MNAYLTMFDNKVWIREEEQRKKKKKGRKG